MSENKNIDTIIANAWERYNSYDANTSSPLKSGWTVESGIYNMLRPFVKDMDDLTNFLSSDNNEEEVPSFVYFENLGYNEAVYLLEHAPAKQLQDSQNYDPEFIQLLIACILNPGKVKLSGYYVGPSRGDERVTIERLNYFDHQNMTIKRFHDESCQCDELWETVANDCQFNQPPEPDVPDAIVALKSDDGTGTVIGWSIWWD